MLQVPTRHFEAGSGKAWQYLPEVKIQYLLAPFTRLNDDVTGATVKSATAFTHEEAFMPFFYRLTNHLNHVLSLIGVINFKPGFMPDAAGLVKENRHILPIFKEKAAIQEFFTHFARVGTWTAFVLTHP
ncbi:MAG: hypothetical protein U5R49_11000 [Deltaproteobacteria bacterium]|nr:hypothetical protein [Deltaproteobacteria bacterium]